MTAQAITRPSITIEADSTPMVSLAQWVRGITSVGLKAMAAVNPR